MPPKAATKKAAAPKASAPKKAATTAAATKKAAEATKKTAAKPVAKKDTTTNGATAASKKRKLAEEEEVDESADEAAEEAEKPAAKKTAKKDAEPVAKKTKPVTAAAKKKAAAAEETEDESKAKKPVKKVAAKKAEPKKTAAAKKADTKAAAASKKRKSSEETEDEKPKAKKSKTDDAEVDSQATESAKATESADEEPEADKPAKATKKTATAAPKPPPAHPHKVGKKINSAPTQVLDVYVFGEGSSGELGLGSKKLDGKKVVDVKRPRLNPHLSAKDVGVVQIACGGMHVAALTKDNKILTWGVNDQGALGRDTNWDGGLRDADAEEEEDDDDDDSGINPRESTPTAVGAEHFAPEAKFTQVVASDSATFALTEDGRVYGWGTFRSSDGILGFTDKIQIQKTPEYLPTLKNITALAAGSNHILALDDKGVVVAWGCGQQNQLGRRIIERNKLSSLVPQSMGIPKGKVDRIACGSYHSFALAKDGRVWAWGLNNFAETGIEMGAGEDDAVVLRPTLVESLKDYKVKQIAGGEHHSLACTEDGKLLTWGRLDGHQVGIPVEELPADRVIKDESNNPRILSKPTVVEDIAKCVYVAAGVDNNFAIDNKGEAHSWGFSANYQTGQGTTEDIETPTTIDNTAVRGKKLVFAGAGGQYSILGGAADVPKVNGFAALAASQPATGGFRPVF
ncbi:protein pim1 [Colletotrichum spaethianum]|uniref:Protein pim1 n=1 Tax=Colletotrichum spaethianum TaxID=700344 RepID=A0AA37PC99_9PEZI|nr:protein pim1 [Colletotrichum spaethianum]GKT49572.1 protein pim1 [Colletotrichum spaethianum]